jgi:hypothetical protein
MNPNIDEKVLGNSYVLSVTGGDESAKKSFAPSRVQWNVQNPP